MPGMLRKALTEGQQDKGPVHDILLVIAGEDAPKPFPPLKQAFCFMAPVIEFLNAGPGRLAMVMGRHHRDETRIPCP